MARTPIVAKLATFLQTPGVETAMEAEAEATKRQLEHPDCVYGTMGARIVKEVLKPRAKKKPLTIYVLGNLDWLVKFA